MIVVSKDVKNVVFSKCELMRTAGVNESLSDEKNFSNFVRCFNLLLSECDCDESGSYTDVCEVSNGQCPCLPNFKGRRCDQCADGYYGYPRCRGKAYVDVMEINKLTTVTDLPNS